MRHLLPLLPVLLLLPSCKEKKAVVPFTAENAVAVATPEAAYVNEHYQFKIEGLPQKWKLLHREEMDSILPDAVVGGARVGGTFAAVIVEPIGGAKPDDYCQLIANNLTTTLAIDPINEFEETPFAGREARTFEIDAVVSGVPFRYRFITFTYKGFGYQVLSWHAVDPAKGSDPGLTEFSERFSLLGGEPSLPPLEPLPDLVTQGARVRDGRFESGVFRFALQPTPNWRVLAASALETMALDAQAGLEAPRQGLYVTFRVAPLGAHEPAALQHQLGDIIAATLEDPEAARPADDLVLTIGGEPVTFLSHVVPGAIETRFYNAIVCRNGFSYNLEAWHLNDREGAPALLQEAFDGMEFLSSGEAEAISREIAASVQVPSDVGPGYSFRKGTYRNFEANFRWQSPHKLWQVFTGDDAVAMNPDTSLWASNLGTGLSFQIITEESGDFTPEGFHSLIMDFMAEGEIDPQLKELPPMDLGGIAAQVSRITFGEGPQALTYRIATVVHAGRAHQLLVWAQPALMQEHEAAVTSCLEGFRIPSPALQAVTEEATSYRDDRLGWQLDFPGSDWTTKPMTHSLSAIGSMVQFHKGTSFIQVLSLNLEPGADTERIIKRMVQDSLKVNFDRSSSDGADYTDREFAGCRAQIIEATTDGLHMRVATFTEGGVLYMLMAGSESEGRANTVFTNLESGFRILP